MMDVITKGGNFLLILDEGGREMPIPAEDEAEWDKIAARVKELGEIARRGGKEPLFDRLLNSIGYTRTPAAAWRVVHAYELRIGGK